MDQRLRSAFTARGLSAGGRDLALYAGAMHYWRVDRAAWPACLRALRDLGLRAVDTYVPWSVHERAPGRYDFTGPRDLGAFLDEAAAAGLAVVVRPGPHVNAELTGFGFPARILADPEVRAVSARGTPVWLPAPPRMFAVPSYAARRFQDEVATWFAAVAEVVVPRLAPDGPVVAAQVDNEQQLFFRLGAYDHDYHPEALAWWREVAGDVEPPRAWDPADPARCVRWVRFKELYVARALAWQAAALRAAGLDGLALYHNAPPAEPWLVDLPAAATAIGGPCGLDFYQRAADYAKVRRRALYLAGSAAPLPLAPELGCGGPPWLPAMTAADQRSVMLGALAAGVRGFGLYMAVGRERWYGALLDAAGGAGAEAAWVRTLIAALDACDWTALRRRAATALVLGRADARFGLASSLADPLSPVITEMLELGPAGAAELALDPAAAEARRWFAAVERALDEAAVPYVIVDEHVAAHHPGLATVILPTLERVDRATWRALRDAAARGVRVVYGPGRPTCDELGEPLGADAAPPRGAGRMRAGSLGDPEGLRADLAALTGVPEHWVAPGQPAIDCALFEDGAGAPRALFAGNRTDRATLARVVAPPGFNLADALTGTVVDPAALALGPFEVRMLRVLASLH